LTQQWQLGECTLVAFELRMANESADVDAVGLDLDRVETGDPVDVDQVAGGRETHVQDGDQALPTSEHLAVMAELGKYRKRLLHAARRVMNKGGGLHRVDPACPKGW